MKKIFKKKHLGLMLITPSILLAGCASTQSAKEAISVTTKATDNAIMSGYNKTPVNPLFKKSNQLYIDTTPLASFIPRPPLPEIFKRNVSTNFPGRVALNEITSELSRSTGILFDVAQDVYNPSGKLASVIAGAGSNAGGNTGINGSNSGSNQPPKGTAAAADTSNNSNSMILTVDSFVFKGAPLSNALDVLAAKANLSWKWNGSSVELYRYENQSFNVSTFAGDTDSKTTVSTGSSGSTEGNSGGNTSSSGQTLTLTSKSNNFNDAVSYVRSMMSPDGRIFGVESGGIIQVRDTPSVLKFIDKSLKELNTTMKKQVMINVDVYTVALNDNDNYGVDWKMAWNVASQNYGIKYTSPTNTSGNIIGAGVSSGPFAGSSFLVSALSGIGKIVDVKHTSSVTLNRHTAPLVTQKEIAYLKSVKVNTTGSGDTATTTTELTPGMVTSGFNLNVTPTIESAGNILLEYNIAIADIEAIKTYSAGTGANSTAIQLPVRNINNILQRSSIKSGQTLILSGFQEESSSITNSGVGSPNNMLLGGGKAASNVKKQLVIMITPYITN